MSARILSTIGVDEARTRLSELLTRLSSEPESAPVAVGAYRKPQGVLISVQEYETLLRVYEEHIQRRETEAALMSVRAEGGAPSPGAVNDVERAAAGEITYDEARDRILERAHQWTTTPTAIQGQASSGTASISSIQTSSDDTRTTSHY
ncbi:hypothetical protein GCM10007079_07260 [Nocardiopsis terrae]|uniref:PHD/YefM family antitoxin component YafN of YafNO toxin-antitoxin module n=1 Tax=Nocardiopsis terrae TaxID=372655 RepID=A0ABR9HP53_9ACTN|nr:hypothetical protein [Nocardiopsis terrae]MBE1460771.1 PHD/YefM family antitoxin component YafN of YafNO toxin-antitoxin module [Nocardiopsis terrae]GHC73382.1 hypothetical protein GCM10007079_07260 [Nocardiopsis terrae]